MFGSRAGDRRPTRPPCTIRLSCFITNGFLFLLGVSYVCVFVKHSCVEPEPVNPTWHLLHLFEGLSLASFAVVASALIWTRRRVYMCLRAISSAVMCEEFAILVVHFISFHDRVNKVGMWHPVVKYFVVTYCGLLVYVHGVELEDMFTPPPEDIHRRIV